MVVTDAPQKDSTMFMGAYSGGMIQSLNVIYICINVWEIYHYSIFYGDLFTGANEVFE
jgi:hypothetical protein